MQAKVLRLSILIIAIAAGIYHIVFMVTPTWGSSEHNIMHIALCVTLVLLGKLAVQTSKLKQLLLLLLLVMGVGTLAYIFSKAADLELHGNMYLADIDFVIGAVLITVIIVVARLQWGWVLTIVTMASIVYFFLGWRVPGALGFPHMEPWYVMSHLGMNLGSGLFGYLTPISSTVIFYFMLFSGVLAATGVMPMFLEVGKALGHVFRGGAAFTAIIGSSLVGTVTGATVANVALTGAYTIPTMKAQGFRPSSASAIESVSSSGGQIMPPIMGAGAFVMASLIGVPYFLIMAKAIVPALLYYAVTVIGVVLLIRHYDIRPALEAVDKRLILTRLPVFIIPLGLLITLLVQGHSPSWAVVWAMVASIVVSMLSKGTRPSFKSFFRGFAQGAIAGAEIGIALFAIAIVSQMAITTGLGPKVSSVIMSWSAGIVPLALFMIMVGCLILGMGMTTVAAYTITAIVMCPALVRLGVDLVGAHFFAFYFAVFSAVTPPIATAAIVGSRIAGANFWECAVHGFRLSIPLFLIPYALLAQPELLDFPHYGMGALYMAIILIVSGLVIAMTTYRHFLLRLNNLELALCLMSSLLFAGYIIVMQNWLLLFGAGITLSLAIVMQVLRWREHRAAHTSGGEAV